MIGRKTTLLRRAFFNRGESAISHIASPFFKFYLFNHI
jgi:hypothetical protein